MYICIYCVCEMARFGQILQIGDQLRFTQFKWRCIGPTEDIDSSCIKLIQHLDDEFRITNKYIYWPTLAFSLNTWFCVLFVYFYNHHITLMPHKLFFFNSLLLFFYRIFNIFAFAVVFFVCLVFVHSSIC